MRAILFFLLLWPALGAAEIPVVALTPSAELVKSDGQAFGTLPSVVIDGDQAAVLTGTDAVGESASVVHVFSRQPNGIWLQIARFNPPGSSYGPVQDFQFQGSVILVVRRRFVPADDSTRYNIYVVERQGSDWLSTTVHSLPEEARGMVQVVGDDLAFSVLKGVKLYHRIAPGVWQPGDFLPELGYSYTSDAKRGPIFEFDGKRLLIVTSVGVYEPGYSYGYANAVGKLYERNLDGSWSLAATLPTDWYSYDLYPFRLVGAGLASLAGDDLSVIGRIFRRDPHGYWEETGNVLPVTESLSESARAQLRRSGLGLVNGRDLYRRGDDGIWHPRLRVSGSISAIDDHSAVVVQCPASPCSTQYRLFVVNLDTADGALPLPASMSGLKVQPAAVPVGGTVKLTAMAYVHGDVTISTMESRIATGAWQPMTAVDGAFDDAFESAQADVTVGQGRGRSAICIRVTDSAGRISELLEEGTEPCPVVFGVGSPPIGDDQPPRVSEVTLDRTQVTFGHDNALYAFADDDESGSGILVLQFRIDDGVWRSMKPLRGPDSRALFSTAQYTAAQGALPPAVEAGVHSACVRGIDTAGNVSEPECVAYEVTY